MNTESINTIFESFKLNLTDKLPNIIFAIIILIIGILLSRLAKKSIVKFLNKFNIDQPIANYTTYSVYIICLSLTIMIVLSILGIPQATILSVIGVVGVGLGMAFNETLSNLGSGYILLFFKPFKIDDYIEFNGIEGTVVEMHIFNTTLKTFDNKTITIPNSKLANQSITNYTKQDKRRVDIMFNLPYGTDIDFVTNILNDLLMKEYAILKDPEHLIAITKFNENSIEFVVRAWVKTEDYWRIFYSLMSSVEKELRKNNIEMNIPQKIIYDIKKEVA